MEERKRGKKIILVFMAAVLMTGILGLLKENAARASQMKTGTASGGNLEEALTKQEPSEFMTEPELSELVQLQIPQRMEIVMDPWQIDGKEQIYSEEYSIRNIGDAKGVLKLTGIAVGGKDEVVVRSDDIGIHDGDGKNIFVEMVINGEDRLTLLPEGIDYELVLETGVDVKFTFTGKLNENAGEGWDDADMEIKVVYDWVAEPEEGNYSASSLREEDEESPSVPNTSEEGGEKSLSASNIPRANGEEFVSVPDTPEDNGEGKQPASDMSEEDKEEQNSDTDMTEKDTVKEDIMEGLNREKEDGKR